MRIDGQNDAMRNSKGESISDYWTRKKEIKTKYDALSSVYEEVYRDEQLKKYRKILSNLQKRPRRVCIEIGCGTGFGLEACSEIFDNIWVGIDLSRSMLNQTRRRIRGQERRHLILADSDFSPLRTECADLALCVTLLSRTPEPVRTLQELRRLTDSIGEIVVTVLKREFTRYQFQKLILESRLRIQGIEDDNDIKDHIFFCTVG